MANLSSKLTRREQYGLTGFVVILTGGVLAGWGGKWFNATPLKPVMTLTEGAKRVPLTAEQPAPAAPKELVVYVSGAVKKPAVYRLKEGQRFYEAIEKAGGFLPNAWQDRLNLAEPLKDGDHLKIPVKPPVGTRPEEPVTPVAKVAQALTKKKAYRKKSDLLLPPAQVMLVGRPLTGRVIDGEQEEEAEAASLKEDPELTAAALRLQWGPGDRAEPPASRSRSAARSRKSERASEGSIDLNSATEEELETLPGVGATTAQRIIKYREEKGGFDTPDDLMGVKGIGQKTLDKIKSRLRR